jgi:ubiquinone/menaquinone biosynthesis C-methylase UbiE
MNFYDQHILPHVINLAMRNRELLSYRERVISAARGRVLEIGIGSGLNLPFYGAEVEEIVGLEPAARLIAMARSAAEHSQTSVRMISGSAQIIPIANHSVDTVVTTWTLCSIPDAVAALREMRRVLRSEGRLLFVEHGLAPEQNIQKWQNRLTPIWKKIGGGCHLNRPIGALIESAGFRIVRLEAHYLNGPNPLTFMYEGCAAPQ